MRQLVSLQLTFEVEDEDRPEIDDLIASLEAGLSQLEAVDYVSADIATSVHRYDLVVEVEGTGLDTDALASEMSSVVVRLVKLRSNPRVGEAIILDEMED